MVIAKCLRSPQQGSVKIAAAAGTTVAQLFSLIGMKIKFNNLRGLFRRRHKLPFRHGVLACLNKQGVSPGDACAFHTSVRRDDDFDFHLAVNIHSFGEVGIQGCRLGFDLALGFVRRTRLGNCRSAGKNERRRSNRSELPPQTSSHRHYSSKEWKIPRVIEFTWYVMTDRIRKNQIRADEALVSDIRRASYGIF